VLVHVDRGQCEYQFEWPTAVVCKSSPMIPVTGCKFVDREANVSFDLTVLARNGNDIQVHLHVSVVLKKCLFTLCFLLSFIISFW